MISQEVRRLRQQYENQDQGHLFHNVLLFSRVLREIGLDANPTRTIDLLRSLGIYKYREQRGFLRGGQGDYVASGRGTAALRLCFPDVLATLAHSRRFDSSMNDVPPEYWGDKKEASDKDKKNPLPPQASEQGADDEKKGRSEETQQVKRVVESNDEQEGDPSDTDSEKQQTYSASDVLQSKDFQDFTTDELAEAKRLMASCAGRLSLRPTRRLAPSRHGRRLDGRRTVRRSLKYGGMPIELSWRDRKMEAASARGDCRY